MLYSSHLLSGEKVGSVIPSAPLTTWDTELSALLRYRVRDDPLVLALNASSDPSGEMATRLPPDKLLRAMESGSTTSNWPSSGAACVRVATHIAVTTPTMATVHATLSRQCTRDAFVAVAAAPTAADVRAPTGMLTDFIPVSAAAKSAADAKRSAGSLARAVITAASIGSGTVARDAESGAGAAVSILATIACDVGPVNGGSPASIS